MVAPIISGLKWEASSSLQGLAPLVSQQFGQLGTYDSFMSANSGGISALYRSITEVRPGKSLSVASALTPKVDQNTKNDPKSAETIMGERLKFVRKAFSENRHEETIPEIKTIITDIERELSQEIQLQGVMLSYYYTAKIMLNVASKHKQMFDGNKIKNAVQILLLDPSGQNVLLQKRGPFKRLFADTYTVSANAKPEELVAQGSCHDCLIPAKLALAEAGGGDPEHLNALDSGLPAGQAGFRRNDRTCATDSKDASKTSSSTVAAIKKEVGIDVDPSRLKFIGDERGHKSYLASLDFHAFSPEEEKALQDALSDLDLPAGINAIYSLPKRSLTIFTTDPAISHAELRALANPITKRTGIPSIYPVLDHSENTLVTYRLTEEDMLKIRSIMAERNARKSAALEGDLTSSVKDMLKEVDSDEMNFVNWLEVRHFFKMEPRLFALDLAGPYFGSDAVWSEMGCTLPDIVPIDDPIAGYSFISGGKGSNTHFLRTLRKDIPGLNISESAMITSYVFEQVVLSDRKIQKDIILLDSATKKNKRFAIAKRIRDRIGRLKLPDDLVRRLAKISAELGGDVAVRSSANSEDMKVHAAPGRAESCLHQINVQGVAQSVIKVWQSLYSDGFVDYRKDIGFPNAEARMPVLLQRYVSPSSAGVVFSFDQATRRPVYRITAQPGLGEGVVGAIGRPDKWVVEMTGKEILEKEIVNKEKIFVEVATGGTRLIDVQIEKPSMSDDDVLKLAKLAKAVHEAYRKSGKAEHVDLEYVLDKNNRCVIVQARPKEMGAETTEDGKKVFRFSVLDVDDLPDGVKPVKFYERSQVAYPGAVTGRLQVLHGPATEARPGRILATQTTNNEFNSVFASLLGVITTDGDPTSHAGQHSFEKRIPCIVGAQYALSLLEPYDGCIITFDASGRIFVEGEHPIKEIESALSIWYATEDEVNEAIAKKDPHEIFRSWEESKRKRASVFLEDHEGHWRRRSSSYGAFQLDYYYQAWDRLTEILNEMYAERRPWELSSQRREIKAEERGRFLMHSVTEDDPRSIHYFLKGVRDFGIDDCEKLFNARWNGFKEFAGLMGNIASIDRDNVTTLVDGLVDAFVWMHFGFWLDEIVEQYASTQLQYVSSDASFHNVLRSEAVADIARDDHVDVLRPDVPGGKTLYLSRNKDKEIYSVLERIRSDKEMAAVFDAQEEAMLRETLRSRFPEIFERIDRWSMRYKNAKEDLDWPSDTNEYLSDLKRRIQNASVPSMGMLANFYRVFIQNYEGRKPAIGKIKENDPEFYLLLRGQARYMAARGSITDWNKLTPKEQNAAMVSITAGKIDEYMTEALKEVRTQYLHEAELRRVAKNILNEYPRFKRIMTLYEMQLALREDGHHLIVPHQRKIAKMMLDAAQRFVPSVMSAPEDVFKISTDEFVGLLQEDDPTFIKKTFARSKKLYEAEMEMVRQWGINEGHLAGLFNDPQKLMKELISKGYINKYGAIQDKIGPMKSADELTLSGEFENIRKEIFDLLRQRLAGVPAKISAFIEAIHDAVEILKAQENSATIPRVKDHYRREAERLLERAERLSSLKLL